jgi:thiol-disulfide isomerase/thioredoxin
MNRRTFFSGMAALSAGFLRAAPTDLLPLDEQGFQKMVAAHHGKVLLVDFWATWCVPCREELPKLAVLHGNYKTKGLDFVTVSCDEPEQKAQAAAFVRSKGAPGPYYIREAKNDDAFINAIDTKWSGALPALFLFDRAGHQAQSFIGETSIQRVQSALQKLLAAT